jgi:hypothetical protein
MSVKFGLHVAVISRIINFFPALLKPSVIQMLCRKDEVNHATYNSLIGTMLSYYNPSLTKAILYIKPLISEREHLLHRNGWDWSELPVGVLTSINLLTAHS